MLQNILLKIDVDSIIFDGMAIIQMFPVPTSAATSTDDAIASLFCVSDGIPAREKHGEDMSIINYSNDDPGMTLE